MKTNVTKAVSWMLVFVMVVSLLAGVGPMTTTAADPATANGTTTGVTGQSPYEPYAPAPENGMLPIEAELVQVVGAKPQQAAQASNGYLVSGIGGEAQGTVSYKVHAKTAGARLLRVRYAVNGTRSFEIAVNGVKKTVECVGTDDNKPEKTAAVMIDLKVGENTIVFGGVGKVIAPNLDMIEVELTQDELVATVNGLFAYIPTTVTNENKMVVTAINKAYRSLANTTGVDAAGVVKLLDALHQIDILEGKIGYKYNIFPIEAEVAANTTNANIKPSEFASNNWFVGDVGGAAGSVTFNVNIEEAGDRLLSVYYILDGNRNLEVTVNGTKVATEACSGSQWEVPAEEPKQIKVTLKKGMNTITLGNAEAVAPDIDRIKLELKATEAVQLVEDMIDTLPEAIKVENTDSEKFVTAVEAAYNALPDVYLQATAAELAVDSGRVQKLKEVVEKLGNLIFADSRKVNLSMEAETATMAGAAELIEGVTETSNGYLVGSIINTDKGNGTVTFNIEGALTAERDFKIYFATAVSRDVVVTVNNEEQLTLKCVGNNINSWKIPNEDPAEAGIVLRKGTNVIKISAANGTEAPNIDRIEVELTEAEAQATVCGMIDQLPEVVSEDNDMIVNGVNKAYMSLPKKDKVTNYSKLAAALDKLANIAGSRTAQYPYLTLEGDLVELKDGAKLSSIAQASNGSYVGKLAGKATAVYKVNVATAGKRLLKIYYTIKGESKLNVGVNNAAPVCINLSGTSNYKAAETPRSVVVDLIAGENTIVFSASGTEVAPNIDKIELELVPTEATAEVIDLINQIKPATELTVEDRAFVHAVEIAYESLSDKTGVTNYNTLKAAIDRINALVAETGMTETQLALKEAQERFEQLEDIVAGLRAEKDIYTEDSWLAVENAYASAKAEYDKGNNASAEVLTELVDALEIAIDQLLTKDLKAAQDLFKTLEAQMNSLHPEWYTEDSWQAVVDAYANAKVEFDKGNKADYALLNDLSAQFEKAMKSLVLRKITVTFNSVGGTAVEKQSIDVGAKVTKPADPTRDEYTFMYWQLNGEEFNFDTPVEVDITLIAKWILTRLQDAFDQFEDLKDDLGDKNKDDYTDESWNKAEDALKDAQEEYDKGDLADPDQMQGLVDNLKDAIDNLTTKEEASKATVTFDSMGGTAVEAQKVKKGEKATKPADPVKTLYTFLGWFDNGAAFNFDTPINEDKTLTAKWILTALKDAQDAYNDLISKLPNPGDYTDGSWKDVQDAYDAAKNEFDKGDLADPDKLRELVARLNAAINALVRKSAAPAQTEVKVTSITLHGISKKIAAGKKITLEADVLPENATNPKLTWESSNTRYATVDANGVVKVKKAGKKKTVTITAKAADGSGVSATYKIKIMPKAVKRVVITTEIDAVKAGQKVELEALVSPSLPKKQLNAKLLWISSNTKYATVTSKGVVKTKKAGKNRTVKITAMATDGSGKKSMVKIKLK